MNTPAMSVTEAVTSRTSKRAFLDRPVSSEQVRELLTKALHSPSGGNLQPWHIHVLGGTELENFKTLIREKRKTNWLGEGQEYMLYPDPLQEPYFARRWQCTEDMYATMGLTPENKAGRIQFVGGNFEFWNAPVAIFLSIDRSFGPMQWVDLGLWLQTLMLLAREAGLDTCTQAFWTLWHKTIAEYLALPPHLMPFCGVALGYADPAHPVNGLHTARITLDEMAVFRGV